MDETALCLLFAWMECQLAKMPAKQRIAVLTDLDGRLERLAASPIPIGKKGSTEGWAKAHAAAKDRWPKLMAP